MPRTATDPDPEEKEGGKEGSRRTYISALLSARSPPSAPVDSRNLLARIDSKTEPLRTPYSANISRKDASILAALAPPGQEKARLGKRAELAPEREASRRKGFEAFEWEREKEPLTAEELAEAAEQMELAAATPEGQAMEESPLASEEVPAPPPPLPPPLPSPLPPETHRPVPAAPPPGEVVVQARPGQRPREGGQFPGELMEQMEQAPAEGSTAPERARPVPPSAPALVSYERGFSGSEEEAPQETVTREDLQGAAPTVQRRWPSESGLELHIDGFEDMARAGDICPRCGRRISIRNRLLTCSDCGVVACESCEIRTSAHVDSPYYYDWRFQLPLCIRCFEKAYNIQKSLSKAKSSLGMGNYTYAYFHAQQALKVDPVSPYAEEARGIVAQIDKRRREAAEADAVWKKQRDAYSRTTVVHEK